MGETDQAAIRAATGTTGIAGAGRVWVQNRGIVEAFVAISSQWRTSLTMVPDRGLQPLWLGLDYAAARAGLELAGIEVAPRVWAGVRVMEDAARRALNGKGC